MNAWLAERGRPVCPLLGRYVDHLEPLVRLALNTGCRRGELFHVEWRDIDFVGARLTVRGRGTKNRQTRVIPLNADAITTLQQWAPARIDPKAYIFPGQRGKRMTTVKTAFTGLMTYASIEDFTFHCCRHTFASRLVMAGVDLRTVGELLGHRSYKMTMRYAHLAPEHKAAAVEKLVSAR